MKRFFAVLLSLVVSTSLFASHDGGTDAQPQATNKRPDYVAGANGEDDFFDKKGNRVHFTGTYETRTAEMNKALDARLAAKGMTRKDYESLPPSQSARFLRDWVKEDQNISPNTLRAIFNDLCFLKMVVPSKEIRKELAKKDPNVNDIAGYLDETLKLISIRFNLPDEYWNWKVSEKEADQYLNGIGEAIGKGLGEAMGQVAQQMVEGFGKALQQAFDGKPNATQKKP